MTKDTRVRTFYEVQSRQKRKSLFVLGILFLFYFGLIGLLFILIAAGLSLLSAQSGFLGRNIPEILAATLATSLVFALFHYFDARNNGAAFIRRRLAAVFPELSDRYHRRFANTLEEMRLACGLPRVAPYILPDFAVNSMALIERDGSPSVLVTEGLLADFSRDELQAVIAHELAHILRGDSFHITLVCSLANIFERIRLALEPAPAPRSAEERIASPLVFAAATVSSVLMRLLSTLVSRERELLADATAVEICRSPRALARAIYKAHVKNSFVGDFNLSYAPLLIVPPGSSDIKEGFFGRLFNSHPPLNLRLKNLTAMDHTTVGAIIEEVEDQRRKREEAREVPLGERWREAEFSHPGTDRVWMARDRKGDWSGPMTLAKAMSASSFSGEIRMAHLQEGVEATAAEFPQVRLKLRRGPPEKDRAAGTEERCPLCRIPLHRNFYEGVSLLTCPRCGGKYVDAGAMPRIITRKEVAFTDTQIERARRFRERFLSDPFTGHRITPRYTNLPCPTCGRRLLPRPYNYQYVIPVDKCLGCDKIWFDADELEVLQILIEKIDRRSFP
jgi:Zn-dependent protease with chaperone function/Zn-finger nucleic acid-binding protein